MFNEGKVNGSLLLSWFAAVQGSDTTKADSSNTDHSKKVFLLFCFCIKLSCIL